jgi:hypothetical protein
MLPDDLPMRAAGSAHDVPYTPLSELVAAGLAAGGPALHELLAPAAATARSRLT